MVLFVTVGIAAGSLLAATPVYSHVGGTVTHLWRDHIRPRADARYVTKLEARSAYVRVAYGTTPTNVTTSFQVLGPDELHGVSILNDSDVDEQSDIIIGNDGTADILVLASGGPYTVAPGNGVEISAGTAPSLQAVITAKGHASLGWSIYLWCGFNPSLVGTPAQARCMTFNGNVNLFG
jgi:hypothetical protein